VADDPQMPTGKKQPIAEAGSIVDEGTSILLHSEVRTDFSAETLLLSLAQAVRRYGLARRISLDRDPRSVGAPAGSDFPSARLALWHGIGHRDACLRSSPSPGEWVRRAISSLLSTGMSDVGSAIYLG
jgi:hypothetical protein